MTFWSAFQNLVAIIIATYIIMIKVSLTIKSNDMHTNDLLNICGASEISMASI